MKKKVEAALTQLSSPTLSGRNRGGSTTFRWLEKTGDKVLEKQLKLIGRRWPNRQFMMSTTVVCALTNTFNTQTKRRTGLGAKSVTIGFILLVLELQYRWFHINSLVRIARTAKLLRWLMSHSKEIQMLCAEFAKTVYVTSHLRNLWI